MTEKILAPSTESDKPLARSDPSQNEPPSKAPQKISREKEAQLALNSTRFTPGTRRLLAALFLLTLCAVPILQLATEIQRPGASGLLPMFDVLKILPGWAKLGTVRSPAELWNLLPGADQIKSAEKAIENESVVALWLRPRVQAILTEDLHAGTEQVYPGRDRWLFYRPDVDYITGPPFLDSAQLKHREREAGVQPDPIRAIVDFRNQLAARGIDLIVMPVPAKPCLDGEMMTAGSRQNGSLQNASFADFKALLEKERVRVFDSTPLLMKRKASAGGAPLYLETDTHWRPETMEFVAQQLAVFLRTPSPVMSAGFRITEKKVVAYGDILTMLKLPAGQNTYNPQKVTIKQVLLGNAFWRPSAKGVEVLPLAPLFLEYRAKEQGEVFCKTDTHWSGIGCVLAAQAIGEKIRTKLTEQPPKNDYASDWINISIEGDLNALLSANIPKPGSENIRVRSVTDKATGSRIAPDPNSPVLILGDSFTLVFHDFYAQNAGLIDQLALELGFAPDLIGTRGSGATPVRISLFRRSAKDPAYLAKKKIIIWCFAAREFTEAAQGWQKLPVGK